MWLQLKAVVVEKEFNTRDFSRKDNYNNGNCKKKQS